MCKDKTRQGTQRDMTGQEQDRTGQDMTGQDQIYKTQLERQQSKISDSSYIQHVANVVYFLKNRSTKQRESLQIKTAS